MRSRFIIALALVVPVPALADEVPITVKVTEIKDHKFHPDVIELKAHEQMRLVVKNLDPTPEEFESHDLKREKVIPGNSEASIIVGPLDAGEYKFFGEFHEATAQGKIVVK